jgi:hypothetical protein
MNTIRQIIVIHLLLGLPYGIPVKIDPALYHATAAVDLNRYVSGIAPYQGWDRDAVLIIIDQELVGVRNIQIISRGIGIRLAVRIIVGHAFMIPKPGTGDEVVGTVIHGQCRI